MLTKKDYRVFFKSLKAPVSSQEKTFQEIIALYNQSTLSNEYGQINTIEEFQKKLPIVEYDDLREKIILQKNVNSPYLSSEMPIHYEYTSGSSGTPKPIPYTPSLMSSFHRMFNIWSHDILSNASLNLKYGVIYISVSPLNDDFKGHEDDSEYLGTFFKHILHRFLIGQELKKLKDKECYLECLSYILISNPQLEIISIWSPSLFVRVINFIKDHKIEIVENLKKGEFKKSNIHLKFSPLSLSNSSPITDFFPSLKLISCWADAQAKNDYHLISKIFKNCLVQKKGILATEAPISLPLININNSSPLLGEIFFEFIDSKGKIKLINDIKIDEVYSLIISTKGGFYRYKIGDNVLIKDKVLETPTFEFVGRSGNVSDLCGEKLSETELIHLIEPALSYALFPNKDHYVICAKTKEDFEKVSLALKKSPHYSFCLQAQQLRPPHFVQVDEIEEKIQNFFMLERQMKLGDIKIQHLYAKESDHELLLFLKN